MTLLVASTAPSRRSHRLAWGRPAVAVALVMSTVAFLTAVSAHNGFYDLRTYYGAMHFWLQDGGQLYDYLASPREHGSAWGFTYPPFAALLMSPMALVDWRTTVAISTALSALSLFGVLYVLVDPIIRRRGWPRWFAWALAAAGLALCEPVGGNFAFGQVNLVLVLLVVADGELMRRGQFRYAGIGIGLAAAIKLTPAIFVVYLVVSGQRRAAGIATVTAAAATLLTAVVAPQASWTFWTHALWNTSRVGQPTPLSNQSLRGAVARMSSDLSPHWWVIAVVAVLAVWAVRVRHAAAVGDHRAGFALTAVAGCLVSPITWMHHLVWLLPALIVLADAGLRCPAGPQRSRLLGAAVLAYLILCSRVVWLWNDNWSGLGGLLGGSLYVWVGVALLLALPVGRTTGVALDTPRTLAR